MVCGKGEDYKCAGTGRKRARFLKLLQVLRGFKFCGCGAEADKNFNPAQDSMAYNAFHSGFVFDLSLKQ